MLTIFNYYPKMGKTIFLNVFGACDGGMSSLIFVRANRKKNSSKTQQQKIPLTRGQKQFCPFGGLKKFYLFSIKFSFERLLFEVQYAKGTGDICKFSRENLHFSDLCDLKKLNLGRAAKFADFWN